jgi:hypothetical protein
VAAEDAAEQRSFFDARGHPVGRQHPPPGRPGRHDQNEAKANGVAYGTGDFHGWPTDAPCAWPATTGSPR